MSENWTRLECEFIVDDYLDMLEAELRQRPFSKAEHRRALKTRLRNRTDGSIEYKHQNISAVMISAGHVYIRGYKPAWNYQDLLEEVALQRISHGKQNIATIEDLLIDESPTRIRIDQVASLIEEPPGRLPGKRIRDRQGRTPCHVDYAAREARNRYLGVRGEEFVLQIEQKRLAEAGREDLIGDIEWTSEVIGDGAGYDIRSFRGDSDEPLYIEVKTTNSGKYQPFLISANEVSFSSEHDSEFSLYRVFDFARSPRLFCLEGRIDAHVELTPTAFFARF